MDWYLVISTVLIPLIVMLLRKVGLTSKWAPIAAFGVASALVGIGQIFGLTLDINTIAQAILVALGTAGTAVLGYDQLKKLAE